MKIKEIRIEGLFGMFDHTIPLNQEDGLTIVYGINGIGKTMIFRLIHHFLNEEVTEIANKSFDTFTLVFDNEEFVTIKNDDGTLHVKSPRINNLFHEKPIEYDTGIKRRLDFFFRQKKNYRIEEIWIKGVLTRGYFDRKLNTFFSLEGLVAKYFDELPKSLKSLFAIEKEIESIIKNINTYLIKTQRLFIFPKYEEDIRQLPLFKNDEVESKQPQQIIAVEKYSEALSNLIRSKHSEYRKISEELELSLGKRLMKKQVKTDYSYKELVKEKAFVEQRLKELRAVGLLPKRQEGELEIDENMDALSKAVISVNIQDFKTKLKIFDDIHEKLELFLDILNNKRFSYKRIIVSEEKGFEFENYKGKTLLPNQLSSGEQHELILMYLLLFEVPENSLIMIDEPEISLHISWQKEFIKDMKDIIRLRKFDILVATHSPSIINGNWDLTVSLKGIEEAVEYA